jgi:hypothetical protein
VPDPHEQVPYKLRYEIFLKRGGWTAVDVPVFRSWAGDRRITGGLAFQLPYTGPVYEFHSHVVAVKATKSMNPCPQENASGV